MAAVECFLFTESILLVCMLLELFTRDHSFSTYAKFSGNLHFLPPDTHTCAYQGVNVSFSERFFARTKWMILYNFLVTFFGTVKRVILSLTEMLFKRVTLTWFDWYTNFQMFSKRGRRTNTFGRRETRLSLKMHGENPRKHAIVVKQTLKSD